MEEKINNRAYSYKEYNKLIKLPLKDKILWSNQIILNALKNSKNHAISCSWGKDSIVMLHLIRKFCKVSKVIFANTLVEYKQTYAYRDKMLKYFDPINYIETKPIKNFWECVKEYGYPELRKQSANRPNNNKISIPKCCIFLKEKPMQQKQKELGIDTVFIGLQATESMNRRLLFLRMGAYYFNKTENISKVLPIIIWNDQDIWAYIKKENIPMNPIYKIMKRNGCMFCTGFKDWKKVMAKYNKKMYQSILLEKEGQRTIDCLFVND